MIDLQQEHTEPVRAHLVAVSPSGVEPQELCGLVHTLGLEVTGSTLLTKQAASPRYGIGTGKAEEIIAEAQEQNADCIIFDFNIGPTQQRNWEQLGKLPVFDRQEVILRIFSQRAQTREAVLQVELAKLGYSLPRLAHTYGDMARQRGGSYGSKGTGETQLELDRRSIMDRMAQIRLELQKVVKERETKRKRRDKIPIPSCALVGYTNAGKSSLLNALTGASVFVEDKLFATLDPTTRRLDFPGGTSILLTDTVGFISNLPHNLVDAFRSTLEEAALADCILLVIDASDADCEQQYHTTIQVLQEIGAQDTPKILVLNKMDKVESPFVKKRLEFFEQAVQVSAKTGVGFDILVERISAELLGEEKSYLLPLHEGALAAQMHKNGKVISCQWQEDGIHIQARIQGKTAALAQSFLQ